MNLEETMLSEISQTQEDIYCMILRKHGTAAAAKSLQSCPTLCDPKDDSPPGFTFLGILSRQEHRSGPPFPSPMYESEK